MVLHIERFMKESLFFLTFHKVASSMVSNALLPNVKNYEQVDFAKDLYAGKDTVIEFEPYGKIYGPIRLSLAGGPVYEKLNKPLIESKQLESFKFIAMTRDPRDILVSFYYSITQSHGFSRVKEIRARQESNREHWLERGLEEYIEQRAPLLDDQFMYLADLLIKQEDSIVIKYESMISDFELFSKQLRTKLDIDDSIISEIYDSTRPTDRENQTKHRRSGKIGGHSDKLSQQQLSGLNDTLKKSLEFFSYA
jgi:hypothetical protein